MNSKYIFNVKAFLLPMILLIWNTALPNEQKKVEIIFVHCGCDFSGSIDFDMIKKMGSGPCSSGIKFEIANFYDSILRYINHGILIEDSTSNSRAYGTNLEMYIGVSQNDSIKYEFAIDYKGYIFLNDKTYYPSKKLSLFLCSILKYNYCICKGSSH